MDWAQKYLDIAGVMFIALDEEGNVTLVNKKACKILGYATDQMIGTNWFDNYLSEVDRAQVKSVFNKLMNGEVEPSEYFENIVVTSNGEERLVAWHNAVVTDENGKIVGTISSGEDVTARRRAEEGLQKEKRRFQVLAENAPYGLVMITEDGAFTYINPRFIEMFGFSWTEIPNGKEWFRKAFPDPACRRKVISTWIEDLDKSKPGEQRPRIFTVTCKDGTEKIIHFRPVQLFSGDHLMTCEDMTELQRSNKALQENVSMLENLLEKAADGICVCHNIATEPYILFTHWNPVMTEITGYTMEEINELGWYQSLYPDPEVQRRAIERMASMRERDDIQAEEWVITTKDGVRKPLSISTSVVKENNGEIYVLALMQDISKRKKAEEDLRASEATLRTLLQAAPIGIGHITVDRVLGWTNQFLCEMTGYSSEELEGKSARILYESDKEFLRVGRVKHPQVLTHGTGTIETRFRKKDGSILDVLLSSSAIVPGDMSQGLVFTAMDITGNKRLEKQLLQSQKMEAIGTLAGGIAHDFNNLLQVIQGYASVALLDKEPDSPDFAELNEIRDAARAAGELTQGLLTFSRGVESRLRPLNINHELEQVLKMLRRTIPRMIHIKTRFVEKPETIKADPTQLQQIVMNLAVNARDAMPDGGTLFLETTNVYLDAQYCRAHLGTKPGRYVMLAVSDTGCGMSHETIERIFDPFFTTKEVGQGTGLGLAAVYGIVKSHGGSIDCASELRVGTTFKVYLPAIATSKDERETEHTEVVLVGGTETILLVDDEESLRRLGEGILTKFGYSVLSASNGREALRIYSRERDRISLIILDLIMPEMGGRECLHEIKQIDPSARVLITSGYAANNQIELALKEGAHAAIEKPYDVKQMLDAVRKALDE